MADDKGVAISRDEMIGLLAVTFNAGIDAALSPNRMPPIHDFPKEARAEWFANWVKETAFKGRS
jgi:hypothetical protein